jgi:glycosyltransferase involved in cell wall biosynthesis
VLLVGEDDLSHAALARRLGASLAERGGMDVTLRLVPLPNALEARLIRFVRWLGELDFQPLRWKLRYSARARWLLRDADAADVALVNTQACALLSRGIMRRTPVVLSVDVTGRQFAGLQYWRRRGRFSRLADWPLDALERRAYAGANRIVAWTDWTAASLRADYGVPAELIAVLHVGVPVPDAAAAGPLEEGDGALRVVFVGNGVERKGLDTLLRARELARAAVEVDVVTGDPVPERGGVTVHHGVQAGSAQLAALYDRAQAFVLPTRADGVPWVVVEALAAGLPLITTDVGGISELVGDAGLLVPPGDAAALAEALDRLAGDPALRRDLARRARERARSRFDEAQQIPRLAAVLRAGAEAQ